MLATFYVGDTIARSVNVGHILCGDTIAGSVNVGHILCG